PAWPDRSRPAGPFCRMDRAGLCSAAMRISRVTLTRSVAALAVALAMGSALAATVYKWVDENGVRHYTDQPHPKAEQVAVKSVQTYQSSTGVTQTSNASSNSSDQPSTGYRVCALSRPERDEVFLNTHTVTARLRLDPPLREGDRVSLALDGKPQTDQP